jgi:transposase
MDASSDVLSRRHHHSTGGPRQLIIIWNCDIEFLQPADWRRILPKRWIVERTFARISRNRRLARDFERYATTVAAFIRLAMIRIMLRRLAANASS